MKIQSGKMRQVITIQEPGTAGPLGQPSWDTFTTARAQLSTLTGRELNLPQLAGSDVSFKFTIRYIAGLKATMRVVMGARTFRILYPQVNEEGNARTIDIFVKEVMTA